MTLKDSFHDSLDNIVTMTEHPVYRSRRRLLQLAGATAMGAAGPTLSTISMFGGSRSARAASNGMPCSVLSNDQANDQVGDPPSVGVKFGRDGHVLPFPGNTIICHLPQQGSAAACFNALLDIYREAPAHAFMRKVTMLPPSSYHMTVFGAAASSDRRPEIWPKGLPLDAPMSACHRLLAERLRTFKLDCALPLRMRVDLSDVDQDHLPLRVRLIPADGAESKKLSRLRDRLSETLTIREPDHESYGFHITLGYLIRWLTPEENITFRKELRRWRETLAESCPVIELGAPEYCTFDDMFAFHRQLHLT